MNALVPSRYWLALAVVAVLMGFGCGGRAAPPSSNPFADDGAGDDGSAYGGVIAASDASFSYDATIASSAGYGEDAGADGDGDDGSADADPVDAASDAGADDACTAGLEPGALFIDELMIESVDGTGDHGEWLEVKNTLACAVDLRGLHGECPHGAKAATFDVAGDLWVPAGGYFVVADSVSPAIDHDVPLPVVAWQGNLGDVLRNKGTTITLSLEGTLIDTLTYPAVTLTVGTSLAFPDDCDPTKRDDFSRWVPSLASWFPGFRGTPNAANTDVACPM